MKVEGCKDYVDSAARERLQSRGRFTRASVGEHNKKTMLYPVGKTPIYDMTDFGLGVGSYFTTLRFLAIVSFVAGCLSIPNMLYFDSDGYVSMRLLFASFFPSDFKVSNTCHRLEIVVLGHWTSLCKI